MSNVGEPNRRRGSNQIGAPQRDGHPEDAIQFTGTLRPNTVSYALSYRCHIGAQPTIVSLDDIYAHKVAGVEKCGDLGATLQRER